ncbi:MAG: putative MFS family arabinose efflux permease [Rhodothermales bacterium]
MSQLRAYLLVTLAYWGFMLTDGALRMLVLLYFHEAGFSPVQLAFLFVLYELCGVITNLSGGWLAQRRGLRFTLISGLSLQVLALLLLSSMRDYWPEFACVVFVMFAQALSGIAKDLSKMSAKTAVKFLAPKDQGHGLFRWVAVLTGSKNAVKGAGFFLGAALLSVLTFQEALWAMAGGIVLLLGLMLRWLPPSIGEARSKPGLRDLLRQPQSIHLLSAARLFLFGARDIWFVVGVPVFAATTLGWSFMQIGGFMAAWIIAYGGVQAVAPRVLGRHRDGRTTVVLCWALAGILIVMICGLRSELPPSALIIGGLFAFGVVFALNSSLHSFLVLHYADRDRAAMSVGYYYMANAAGRLVGTLLSGCLFQLGGLSACLIGATVFVLAAAAISRRL